MKESVGYIPRDPGQRALLTTSSCLYSWLLCVVFLAIKATSCKFLGLSVSLPNSSRWFPFHFPAPWEQKKLKQNQPAQPEWPAHSVTLFWRLRSHFLVLWKRKSSQMTYRLSLLFTKIVYKLYVKLQITLKSPRKVSSPQAARVLCVFYLRLCFQRLNRWLFNKKAY